MRPSELGLLFAVVSLAVESQPLDTSTLTERHTEFLNQELHRSDELAAELPSSRVKVEHLLATEETSANIVWKLLAQDDAAKDTWSRIDRLVVQELLNKPRSSGINQEVLDSQVVYSALLENSANYSLITEILKADQELQADALSALNALSNYHRIQLYAEIASEKTADSAINTKALREYLLDNQAIGDVNLSAQIARRILDGDPLDISVRTELISALDALEETALADEHRLTLKLLESDISLEDFRIVADPEVAENDEGRAKDQSRESVAITESDALPSRADFESDLDYLAERIFQDPTNLSLNLDYFKEQVARGELESAEVTLERILLVDPDSKFAKILMAETQIKLGKLSEARNNLNRLLLDTDLRPEMRQKALDYVAQIEGILNPVTWRHSVGLTAGVANNALGRTDSGTVLFRDRSLSSGQADSDVSFNELSFNTAMSYKLPYETPTSLTISGFGSGRESDHEDLAGTSTIGGSVAIKEINKTTSLESSLSAFHTRVEGQPYANFASLAASMMTGLTENLILGTSVALSKNMYQDFEGISKNTDNSGETVVASLSLNGQVKKVGWSVTGKWSDSNAKDASASNDLASLSMALNYKFDNCSNVFSANQTWARAKAANTFISNKPKRVVTTNWTYGGSCVVENFLKGVSIEPSYKFVWRDADSNIPNYAKESSEYSLGVKLRF